jgi:hypothetical protein
MGFKEAGQRENITLNTMKLDYLTCTSQDSELALSEWTTHRARILQYVGYSHSDNKIFEGFALQKGDLNRLCRLTSSRANELWSTLIGMRATRLDIALDVLTKGTLGEDLQCWSLVSKRASTFIGTHERGAAKGFTLYVGSRRSERFLRIYDKSSEANLETPNVVRFELELKGSLARRVFTMIAEYGLSSPMQHLFRDEVKRLLEGLDLGQIGWFSGDRTPMTVERKERDHSSYLLQQVRGMLVSDQRKGYKSEVREIIRALLTGFGTENYVWEVPEILAILEERVAIEEDSELTEALWKGFRERHG